VALEHERQKSGNQDSGDEEETDRMRTLWFCPKLLAALGRE
jgi:hypothetical protein